jgi:hypothetical protein
VPLVPKGRFYPVEWRALVLEDGEGRIADLHLVDETVQVVAFEIAFADLIVTVGDGALSVEIIREGNLEPNRESVRGLTPCDHNCDRLLLQQVVGTQQRMDETAGFHFAQETVTLCLLPWWSEIQSIGSPAAQYYVLLFGQYYYVVRYQYFSILYNTLQYFSILCNTFATSVSTVDDQVTYIWILEAAKPRAATPQRNVGEPKRLGRLSLPFSSYVKHTWGSPTPGSRSASAPVGP